MKDITYFSANTLAKFDNDYNNIVALGDLMMDAGKRIYTKYSESETNDIIRNGVDRILGIDFKKSTAMQRRQAWRRNKIEIATLLEDVIADKMNSGFNAGNARFMQFVRDVNIANGDKNEFFVEDNSLLQVSKFAGNHHDVRQNSVRVA